MAELKDFTNWILLGDFGLFTLTPKYLFTVLFPIILLLEIMGKFIYYLSPFKKASPLINQFLYMVLGLGCTTVALASLNSIKSRKMKARLLILLILLVPCSSQLAIFLTFASMVSKEALLTYLMFTISVVIIIYLFINLLFPLNEGLLWLRESSPSAERKMSASVFWYNIMTSVKNSLRFIYETAKPFCVGSIVISIAIYYNLLSQICEICSPITERFFHLPASATSLFFLNIIKRDFGSASLINVINNGVFSESQIILCLLILTFFVPCFNSTILLFKQEKLPSSLFIWFGSLLLSITIGKIASVLLL